MKLILEEIFEHIDKVIKESNNSLVLLAIEFNPEGYPVTQTIKVISNSINYYQFRQSEIRLAFDMIKDFIELISWILMGNLMLPGIDSVFLLDLVFYFILLKLLDSPFMGDILLHLQQFLLILACKKLLIQVIIRLHFETYLNISEI